MPDYAALAAELAKPAYAGLSDAAAATALNTPIVEPTGQRVPISEIQRVAFDRGKLLGILQAAQQGNAAALAAQYLFVSARFDTVDIANSQFTGTVASLLSAGLLDAGDVAAVQSLATRATSIAIRVFGVPVSAADVAYARSLN
mgnify:CR=1 FL=1